MPIRKNEARWTAREEWRIDVQSDGQRKSFYSSVKGRKGKIQCERKADEWLEDNSDFLSNPRLEDLWNDHLKEVKRTTSEANYIKNEQLGRLYLLPDLGNKRIASITIQHWQNCITAAGEKGLSKKTCENIRGAITVLYRYARKEPRRYGAPGAACHPAYRAGWSAQDPAAGSAEDPFPYGLDYPLGEEGTLLLYSRLAVYGAYRPAARRSMRPAMGGYTK